MRRKTIHMYEGRLLEEEGLLTLHQICDRCRMSETKIIELVEEGILEPKGSSRANWKFSYTSSERAKKVVRLQRDFELNLSGAALALQLLDRIEQLEARLRRELP